MHIQAQLMHSVMTKCWTDNWTEVLDSVFISKGYAKFS